MENEPNWPDIIYDIIEETSAFYAERFRIKLVIVSFDFLENSKPQADYQELPKYDAQDGNEIIIGFTGREIPTPYGYGAIGIRYWHTLLISNHYSLTTSEQAWLLKHEIGHFFFAIHRAGTLMDSSRIIYSDFDTINSLIIRLAKYQNFGLRKFIYQIYQKLPSPNKIRIKGL